MSSKNPKRDLEILKEFNILYIEDDKNLLKNSSDILEDFVKKIYPTTNTKDALDILKSNKIDVIVSDILLENDNGIDFIKKIRDEYDINTPVILTTAYTDTNYLLESIKLKVENYIIKPVNIKELLNTIHDTVLPIKQNAEIKKSYNIIKTISLICDSKQIEVVRFIFNNIDNDNIFDFSYMHIMQNLDISKPTLVKIFKTLIEKGILTKLQRSRYLVNENRLDSLDFGADDE
jgi:DNA-binding NtrC family response regulator